MAEGKRLLREFYIRDVLIVAPELIGKVLVVKTNSVTCRRFLITETEAYRGAEDKACHASKGRTERTDVMFLQGGMVYVYLVYGIYWMLNIVTGEEDNPQAVLIRGVEGFKGPGKLTRAMGIDKSFYGEDITRSERIWIEDSMISPVIKTGQRIGIDYAGEYWKTKPWRYYCEY
ncbi:MAG TPA: DNA-3-methyladenine glycosylase [Bacteroidales bacterium]|nr:DNA-3-methyladenine glycosylase [Bacteroidales bacterium]